MDWFQNIGTNNRIIVMVCFTIIYYNYSDLRDPDDIVPKYWGNGIHKEDILCIAPLEPDVLVTASYDGDVVLWDVEIEQPIVKLNKGSSYTSQQFIKQQRKLKAVKIKKMECEREKGKKRMSVIKYNNIITIHCSLPLGF